jgi:GNAT superfamily N-acetyltransferase
LYHLFVDRRWQRRGIARRLWEAGRAAALASGASGSFTVNASNYALPFYEALGFVRSGPMQAGPLIHNPMRLDPASVPAATARDGFVAPA